MNPFYLTAEWKALREACLARDNYTCIVEGCGLRAIIADHIETRPPVQHLCEADRLGNLRSLCRSHDAQVKEQHRGRAGSRKQGGKFKVKGCTSDGMPLDPARRWK